MKWTTNANAIVFTSTSLKDSYWPGQRSWSHSKTLWNQNTPDWLWPWQWPRPPGTVEQRWPGGAELPVGYDPGWTDIPHRSCTGSDYKNGDTNTTISKKYCYCNIASLLKLCSLTGTPGKRPRHRWQGSAPNGWRCVPTQQDSERAWPCQKLC